MGNEYGGARQLALIGAVGILRADELKQLNESERRVYSLMADHGWHTADAIELAAGNGVPAREGLRRMRQLRKVPGVEIHRKRLENGRIFVYKLTRSNDPKERGY